MFRSYASHEKNSRIKKAQKIIKIISMYKVIGKSKVLDIGCGAGFVGNMLNKYAKSYTGVDFVDERKAKGFDFARADALRLPFKDDTFDIIICNHVIEHVNDQERLLHEIDRVLKKDGICYITSPNKLWPMEPHLKLPFLSFLPKRLADAYVRAMHKGSEYDVTPMTYPQFNAKLKNLFKVENFTLEVLKNPQDYGFEGRLYSVLSILKYFPDMTLKIMNYFLPNWIIILKKKATF